jgi:hypothetical protein
MSPRVHAAFAVVASAVVAASVAWGFVLAGSPATRRLERFDEQRLQDLQLIAREIQWMVMDPNKMGTLKEALPKTLEEAAERARRTFIRSKMKRLMSCVRRSRGSAHGTRASFGTIPPACAVSRSMFSIRLRSEKNRLAMSAKKGDAARFVKLSCVPFFRTGGAVVYWQSCGARCSDFVPARRAGQ